MEKVNLFAHNWLAAYYNNRALKRNVDIIKGRVLDLGCGASPYKEDILKISADYLGVDWENTLHENIEPDIVADLCERFPFEDGSVDTIVSFQVLEHLKDPVFFLSESHRILKKGGAILLTVPFMWHLHEQPYDFYRFTPNGLQHLLACAGFTCIEVGKYCGFWPVWVLQFNYHSLKYARRGMKSLWRIFWLVDQIMALFLDKLDSDPLIATHFWARGIR